MCNVPPDTGFAELDTDTDGADDELHAASPAPAMRIAAGPARHLALLVMGMSAVTFPKQP
jgi:hypothetical protein